MPHSTVVPSLIDPFGHHAIPGRVSGTDRPVPLVATHYRIHIDGGLATVMTERSFRNVEAEGIEATFTFPVPVHATLFELTARIGQRTLTAKAQRRQAARATYEGAIDRGKTAVLHEEVLRGVHQLSVGHIAPGQEVTVVSSWAMPLSAASDGAMLHVPVTVGEIYGRSPLADSDDLVHRDLLLETELEVECADGTVRLVGGQLLGGRTRVRLDAPVRLLVSSWRPRALIGTAADGRAVDLVIVPAAKSGLLPLDAAILVDRSGSMDSPAEGGAAGWFSGPQAARTKHDVVAAGLRAAVGERQGSDRLDLWEFDQTARQVSGRNLDDAIARLRRPEGGTEIGRAINEVLAGRRTRDVLLITDGKSHAIDIQAAARSGRRFHVVLIGEDSLEANVGHLAAMSGGQVLVATGAEAGEAIRRIIATMRAPHVAASPIGTSPTDIETVLGGMQVRAVWRHDDAARSDGSRAVAAVAGALALPRMAEADAAALAEAEGIVCHLTALVLVDEEGQVHEGLPAQRKVPTMTPRTAHPGVYASPADGMDACMSVRYRMASPLRWGPSVSGPSFDYLAGRPTDHGSVTLRPAIGVMDWQANPEALRRGEFSALPEWVAELLRKAADLPEVRALGEALGTTAVIAAIGLLANADGANDRHAARVARAILGRRALRDLAPAMSSVDL